MAESTGSRLTNDDDIRDMRPTNYNNNFGKVSDWLDKQFMHQVCKGDRLELVSTCSNLPHHHSWAIYKSFWSAVQFFNPANQGWKAYSTRHTFLNVSLPASKDVIVVIDIFMFLSTPGNKLRINNSKDKDWSPLSTRHIVKEVTYQLKEVHKRAEEVEVYVCRNQFKDSEDFVNYCRYDKDHQHNWRSYNYEKVGKWYSVANIEGFIREVRVGDRLEFRGSSPHERWGIYIGQRGDDLDQVVLFAHGDKTNSATSTESLIPKLCVTSIQKCGVLQYDQVRINNESDQKWPPLDRENILKEISRQLPGRAGMHECKLFFRDSEDFVNYFRYDYLRINFGLVSDWGSLHDHRMCVGDRLEFHRTAMPYAHWGIYVGDWGGGHDQVVHFTPADGNGKLFSKKKSSCSGSSADNKPVLCVNDIGIVRENDMVRINNDRDHTWPPLVRTDIVDKIQCQLESQRADHKPVYNVFLNNCEHFVNHCRYGKHHSDQVTPFSKIRDRPTKGQ